DCGGRLVGINTAGATVPNPAGGSSSGSIGIGFAIPVDLATVITDDLIRSGRFTPPAVGMTTAPIPPAVADQLNVDGGLYVQSVSAGGPAARAGLQQGDVVTSLDGKPASTPDSLLLASVHKRAGETIAVEYVRSGNTSKATLTLGGG
ncbi:MAG: serine protease, partial [Acidothermales bacterium]|nr:serine protease [Acidothermales bacterium]